MPPSIPLKPFQFFSKICGDLRSSKCTTGVVDTSGKLKISSIIKLLLILFGHLCEVELSYRYIFALKFTFKSQQPDIVSIICHRYQQHLVKLVAKLPPVLLIPVVHIDLGISTQVFEKFKTVLMGYSGAGGNWFMKKNRSKKSCDTVPLMLYRLEFQINPFVKVLSKTSEWQHQKEYSFICCQCYFLHTDFFHLPMILQLRTLYCNMWQVFL